MIVPAPDPSLSSAVLASLSGERLRPFRQAVDGRHRQALDLYLIDSELASRFHALFRVVEVLLRETMHRALAASFGTRWFEDPVLREALDQRTRDALDEAMRTARRGTPLPPAGAVVASITLGTWVHVLASGGGGRHARAIWAPALSSSFQGSRADVHGLAQRVNWARSRVNHCETVVFGFPLPGQRTAAGQRRRATPGQVLDDARSLAGTMSAPVAEWLGTWEEVDRLVADPRVTAALEYRARDRDVRLEGRRR